jgi:hypothetical protein
MSASDIDLPDDFADLLVALTDEDVAFVVVGGYAVALHGHPRATKDIDVLVQPSVENADRVMSGLIRFGAPIDAFDVKASDFSQPGNVLQLGVPPYRIDLITEASGISFEEAQENCRTVTIDGRTIRFIGLDALLKNKRASGRPQDLADVAALEGLS